jgi:RNA polymerase sigma factor
MVDALIKAANIDDRAVAAKQSKEASEQLISEFKPFLENLAARYSQQYDLSLRDDLLSVVMLAFYESIKSYDVARGHFFPYVKRVARSRIIDYLRTASRHWGKTLPLEDSDETQQTTQSTAVAEASERQYESEKRQQLLVEEIEQFKRELKAWGITFDELSRQSPKQKRLREIYRRVVTEVAENHDIVQTIQLKRYFPVKAIAEITKLPPKKLERARIFVLASLIIKTGDYEILSEYVIS